MQTVACIEIHTLMFPVISFSFSATKHERRVVKTHGDLKLSVCLLCEGMDLVSKRRKLQSSSESLLWFDDDTDRGVKY